MTMDIGHAASNWYILHHLGNCFPCQHTHTHTVHLINYSRVRCRSARCERDILCERGGQGKRMAFDMNLRTQTYQIDKGHTNSISETRIENTNNIEYCTRSQQQRTIYLLILFSIFFFFLLSPIASRECLFCVSKNLFGNRMTGKNGRYGVTVNRDRFHSRVLNLSKTHVIALPNEMCKNLMWWSSKWCSKF